MKIKLPPEYVNTPMGIIYDPRISDGEAMTFIQIYGLYWDSKNPPKITFDDLQKLTGRSKASLYGHLSTLRNSGWLLFSTADDGTFKFSFPNIQSKNLDTRLLIESGLNIDSRHHGKIREGAVQKIGQATMPKELVWQYVNALADVTGEDKTLNYGRMAKESKDLWIAGYTPEQIRAVYSKGGAWFRDWRGRDGKPPTIGNIRQTIKGLLNGSKPAQPEPEEAEPCPRCNQLDCICEVYDVCPDCGKPTNITGYCPDCRQFCYKPLPGEADGD